MKIAASFLFKYMLFLTFTDENAFQTGYTCLSGLCFDYYKSEKSLKFFTASAINTAILTLSINGIMENINFTLN